jgi:hypothetical protein
MVVLIRVQQIAVRRPIQLDELAAVHSMQLIERHRHRLDEKFMTAENIDRTCLKVNFRSNDREDDTVSKPNLSWVRMISKRLENDASSTEVRNGQLSSRQSYDFVKLVLW